MGLPEMPGLLSRVVMGLVLTLLPFHPGQVAFPYLGLSSFFCIMGMWLECQRGLIAKVGEME